MGIAKKYRLYVFDLDGTLADTRDDLKTAFSKALAYGGYDALSDEEVVGAIGRGAAAAMKKLTGLGDEELEPYLNIFREVYEKVCCDNVRLYPGAAQLLRRLKDEGALLALVTMKLRVSTEKIIKHLGIDVFDEVVAYEDSEKRKPDPESFNVMLEKYGVSPGEALMVGDSLTDIRYAKAAGADCCIMAHGYAQAGEIRVEGPRYLLESFEDF